MRKFIFILFVLFMSSMVFCQSGNYHNNYRIKSQSGNRIVIVNDDYENGFIVTATYNSSYNDIRVEIRYTRVSEVSEETNESIFYHQLQYIFVFLNLSFPSDIASKDFNRKLFQNSIRNKGHAFFTAHIYLKHEAKTKSDTLRQYL